ncbi:energy-coupling factor transporter ATPase [Candidatus Contubernalis alkaliaceticus]|uniref:energy-coupling factor transporter ATPase n=1 Tax=Candidatus Contubernalis alkaliaceticus TaxID=338645 RepID=UPI001F4C323B|nr:energy-coupling factor transporter ATPase [Candidatus Contubernalis alkalaceticus]UNC90966.1 energy-coupling factor transporter ATPase [Candidatus Contubernalis alkalaceticus]
MLIQVKDLTHIYMSGSPYEHWALNKVNLEVCQGDFLGLIGRTGSGKTTLVQHLNGLLKPTEGTVLFKGRDLYGEQEVDWREIRQKVGLVFQYPEEQLFGETVFEDVAFGPRKMGLKEEEVERRVEKALKMVNLDFKEFSGRSPFNLSRGEMRRAAMAGVLSMEPEILVMDEPSSGLDPRGRKMLLEQVKQFHRQAGITVIFVSHNMEEVAQLANRLVVMEKGQIVMDGSPAEVFREAEKLMSIGLGIPQVTRLMLELKNKGKGVRTEVFSVEEARREIVTEFLEKQGEKP